MRGCNRETTKKPLSRGLAISNFASPRYIKTIQVLAITALMVVFALIPGLYVRMRSIIVINGCKTIQKNDKCKYYAS